MDKIDLENLDDAVIAEIEEQNNSMTAIVNNSINIPDNPTVGEIREKVTAEERRIRELEIAVWAENQKLLGGEPCVAVLKEVH